MARSQAWQYQRGGVSVDIRIVSTSAQNLLQSVLADMGAMQLESANNECSNNVAKQISVQDNPEGADGWRIEDDQGCVAVSLPGDLVYHLTDKIVYQIADQAKDVHCLHAAVVSHNSKALLIPAESGSGKSSFTVWLVANGFSYVTDELITVNAEECIQGVARPIQIKPHGVDAVAQLIQEPEKVLEGKVASAVPVSALCGASSERDFGDLQVGAFIFPRYQASAKFAFERLSTAEAGMSIMQNHVNARNLDGHGFSAVMSVIRKTPAYRLTYGGFEQLSSGFVDDLRSLLS